MRRCERRHRPDCGHIGGGPRPESLILIAVLGIMAAVLMPRWLTAFDKGKACVDLLARGGQGSCPVTGQAYPPGDDAACVAPHLPSAPRFPRAGGPPEQTLPAPAPYSALDLEPGFFWRWIAAPLVQIFCTVLVGICVIFMRNTEGPIGAPLAAALAGLVALVACVMSAWGSERVEASKGRVVHRRWMLGVERAPLVYEDAKALVPVQPKSGPLQAVVVHGRQATLLATMTVEEVARLDAALR
ncbi:MAG TPA: type II secretion system protein [Planctomycetota bacterium]